MRHTSLVILAALLVIFSSETPRAQSQNEEQIRKLLIGNTLYRKRFRNAYVRELWFYFEGKATLRVKINREKPKDWITRQRKTEWRVTSGGKVCIKNRRGKETCRKVFRISEKTFVMESRRGGRKVKFMFLKGNPEGL